MQDEIGLYQMLLVSHIPVTRRGGKVVSDVLWSLDINTNATVVSRLCLVCPVQESDDETLEPFDERIEVIDSSNLTPTMLEELVREADVLQVSGNFDWSGSSLERRAMRLAKRHDKLSILGISSNRAKTTIMNAAGRALPFRVRARVRAASINHSQRYLARNCDGVRLVGQGLVPLVEKQAKALRIETASWIKTEDICPPRKAQSDPVSIVIASRLEPMKGVALGVEAVADAMTSAPNLVLSVIGTGPEAEPLRQLAGKREILDRTRFLGQLGYPGPFFAALQEADYVLLTNLNDEQPRLIFDAIAQGAIPICPRNSAYDGLGLHAKIFYEQGSSESLCKALRSLILMPEAERQTVRSELTKIAQGHTIEAMHNKRREWVLSVLKAKGTA